MEFQINLTLSPSSKDYSYSTLPYRHLSSLQRRWCCPSLEPPSPTERNPSSQIEQCQRHLCHENSKCWECPKTLLSSLWYKDHGTAHRWTWNFGRTVGLENDVCKSDGCCVLCYCCCCQPDCILKRWASSDWIGFQSVREWTHTVSPAHFSKYQYQLQTGLCCMVYCRQSEKMMWVNKLSIKYLLESCIERYYWLTNRAY